MDSVTYLNSGVKRFFKSQMRFIFVTKFSFGTIFHSNSQPDKFFFFLNISGFWRPLLFIMLWKAGRSINNLVCLTLSLIDSYFEFFKKTLSWNQIYFDTNFEFEQLRTHIYFLLLDIFHVGHWASIGTQVGFKPLNAKNIWKILDRPFAYAMILPFTWLIFTQVNHSLYSFLN